VENDVPKPRHDRPIRRVGHTQPVWLGSGEQDTDATWASKTIRTSVNKLFVPLTGEWVAWQRRHSTSRVR
jgi:hypothetical protein